MLDHELSYFSLGLGIALVVGMALRMLVGTRLNLYLVNSDSVILDQALIPISTVSRKKSMWRTLRTGSWREDIRITLSDYRDGAADFHIKYGLWKRYQLALERPAKVEVRLDGRRLEVARFRALRTGARLEIGDREFTVVVSLSRAPGLGSGIAAIQDEAA